jgi:IS1 family transposase
LGVCEKKGDPEQGGGEQWIWTAVETRTRLLLAHVVGDRSGEFAEKIVSKVRDALEGKPPVFTSDELAQYASAIAKVFGTLIVPEPTGRRGRPRSPYIEIPKEIDYATVNKRREGGVVVQVTRKQVFGELGRTLARLAASPSSTVNTAFVERTNLDWRLWDAHLARKSPTFAKSERHLKAKFALCAANYNFARPHEALSRQSDRSFLPTTPAMAAGILDRPWKIRDLLCFTICQL